MKTTLITTGIVASLLLGVVSFGKPIQVLVSPTPVQINVPEGKTPIVNVQAPEIKIPATVVNVPQQKLELGAFATPDVYQYTGFYDGLKYSSTFATTSTGSGTLTASNISKATTILSTNAGALTLTFPASTSLTSFLPKAGDRAEIVLVNQGTTLLTLAGSTGTLLQTASSTKTVNIGGSARLNIVRKTNSDFIVQMSPAI